jgi:hypothetical protein
VEIVGLVVAAAVPDEAPELVVIIVVTLVCSIQFSVFRILVDTPYTTLLASGNLRTMVVHLHKRVVERDADAGRQAARIGSVVAAFAVAAAIGALCTKQLGNARRDRDEHGGKPEAFLVTSAPRRSVRSAQRVPPGATIPRRGCRRRAPATVTTRGRACRAQGRG